MHGGRGVCTERCNQDRGAEGCCSWWLMVPRPPPLACRPGLPGLQAHELLHTFYVPCGPEKFDVSMPPEEQYDDMPAVCSLDAGDAICEGECPCCPCCCRRHARRPWGWPAACRVMGAQP